MRKIAEVIPCLYEDLTICKAKYSFHKVYPEARVCILVDGDDTYPPEDAVICCIDLRPFCLHLSINRLL